ncbi:PilZ domain-containing protein [Alteromonas sp. ASW11-130]|uniref:PilZ domain-containing protein n=1 Tax=Alteromonas sp. ASW11-130 TaxID=3015775 RepID=UPI0022424F91|nr:PilZ domain-containing protein [Alteromonas sp. ASW11-130]MCW8092401.1 PilZ domain-containing protein [Alteromonas sp. ASW11-130]
MSAGDEKQVIKQFQHLIRALIPYEQDNRLLEGLNKFSQRLPANVRKTIKEEVIRLTSLTDAPADNSAFAQFPVIKFKHFGIDMCLDKIGAQILKKETGLYQNRYTVGVFESITSSEFYQSQIKKEQYKKIVDAFAVESQSQNDIDFGDDIAITPNFQVSSPEFQNGRNCNIASLGYNTMAVELRRPPKMSQGDELTFTFPEIQGFTTKETQIKVKLDSIKFNQHTANYELQFDFAEDVDKRLLAQLKKYIDTAAFHQPLKRELEIERAMQDLERDRILENSPWLPFFVKANKKQAIPIIALFTKSNVERNNAHKFLDKLSGKSSFNRLYAELQRYGEAFLFNGTVNTKKGPIDICATHRDLVASEQMSPLIYLMMKSGTLTCTHCRIDSIDEEDKNKAFEIHDLAKADFPELAVMTSVIFCRDITHSLKELTIGEKCQFPAIPKSLIADKNKWSISYVMEEDLDRRSEHRYVIERDASIKTGLLTSFQCKVKDISASGMQIALNEKVEAAHFTDSIKISVPDFKMRNEKYMIVHYDERRGIMRLKLPEVNKKGSVDALLEQNLAFFRQRDIARTQQNTHRFIWELAMRHHPSVSVLCVSNRHILDRLKTVYQSEKSDDLYPFSRVQNVVPLHGFFADRETMRPKSALLEQFMIGKKQNALVVHCVRKDDNKLVYIAEKNFLYGTMRQNIANHLEQDKVELCVTHIETMRCHSATTPLTRKRLAQLSKIDKTVYDKLSNMQSAYTHVVYLTNESTLHNELLKAKLRPLRPPKADKNDSEGTAKELAKKAS